METKAGTIEDTSYRALFKVRGLAQLLVSTLAARIATQMFSVLLVLFVLETHHSASLSGIVVVCSQVPGIIASPIAGALLDRGSRVALMRLDYLVGSTCITTIGVLSVLHSLPTYLLLLVVSAASVTAPLSRVGGKSLYPVLVPRQLWDRSNAADSGSNVVATVLGPGVAGVAVALVGPRVALFLPAIVMLLAAVLLVRFVAPPAPSTTTASVLSDARAAIGYVWRNRVLRMLAGTMTVFNSCGGILTVAVPFIVLRRLHGGSATVGLLFAIMGATGFLAGLLTGRFGTENREKHLLAMSCMTTAVAYALLALDHHEVVLVALIAVIGIANGPLSVAMFSLRQRATDPQWFGRAFAVSMNLNFVGNPIGAAIAGALLTRSLALTMLVAASCAAIGGIWPTVLPASSYEPLAQGATTA
ncbi:MAG: MFS transporter [Acidimicrobiales bacterium]